jgi:hypothetical protein
MISIDGLAKYLSGAVGDRIGAQHQTSFGPFRNVCRFLETQTSDHFSWRFSATNPAFRRIGGVGDTKFVARRFQK